MSDDIIADIDALIDEQLAAGEPIGGYDYDDPDYPECAHCGADFHGLAITWTMYGTRNGWAGLPDGYTYAGDESPIYCIGAASQGPMALPPSSTTASTWHLAPDRAMRLYADEQQKAIDLYEMRENASIRLRENVGRVVAVMRESADVFRTMVDAIESASFAIRRFGIGQRYSQGGFIPLGQRPTIVSPFWVRESTLFVGYQDPPEREMPAGIRDALEASGIDTGRPLGPMGYREQFAYAGGSAYPAEIDPRQFGCQCVFCRSLREMNPDPIDGSTYDFVRDLIQWPNPLLAVRDPDRVERMRRDEPPQGLMQIIPGTFSQGRIETRYNSDSTAEFRVVADEIFDPSAWFDMGRVGPEGVVFSQPATGASDSSFPNRFAMPEFRRPSSDGTRGELRSIQRIIDEVAERERRLRRDTRPELIPSSRSRVPEIRLSRTVPRGTIYLLPSGDLMLDDRPMVMMSSLEDRDTIERVQRIFAEQLSAIDQADWNRRVYGADDPEQRPRPQAYGGAVAESLRRMYSSIAITAETARRLFGLPDRDPSETDIGMMLDMAELAYRQLQGEDDPPLP